MLRFPRLQSDAITQYPSSRIRDCRTRVVEYVDGSDQRYAETGSGALRWRIRLDQLSDGEANALLRFLSEVRGASGTFVFTDPWTGVEYGDCALEDDVNHVVYDDHERAGAAITIRRVNQ